jgi:endonuclease YncB( thermonuclease family)
MLTKRSLLVLTVVSLAVLPVLASEDQPDTGRVQGMARVIDGDTLDIGATRVRLAVVDTPERDQTCDAMGKPVACGEAARHLLQSLTDGRRVACDIGPNTTHGRVVGYCVAGDVALSAALLDAGAGRIAPRFLAEWPDHAAAMQAAEARARADRRGIWGMHAESPAAYRAGQDTGADRPDGMGECPADMPVKANISTGGRIYHLPGQRHYDRTRISQPGEACLPSAAAAQAAGFRPARS